MSETKRLIKNTGIIAVGGMATKLVSFFLLPLYTSVLTTAEYGTVDYLSTIAAFCVPAISLLMDEAMFRFLIDCKDEKDRARVVTSSCAVLGAGCLAFVFVALVLWLLFAPENMIWIVALVIVQSLLTMTSALLRGFGDTVSYSAMNFSASALAVVMNVLFIAVLRLGVVGMLSATVMATGGVAAVFLIKEKLWRYLDFSAYSNAEAKALLKYSLPLIPNKVSWTIMNMLDRLIIMNTIGSDAAGVYAVSYKFPNVMDQVYGFFYQSWKESSARAKESDEDEAVFYNAVYKSLKRFMLAVVLGMTALMPLVYGVLIKGSFGEGILYVPILLLATYFSNISGFYGGIFTAHKDTGIMGTTTMVSAVLCGVLCLLLIPVWGLYGASTATIAATFVANEYRRIKVARYVALEENLGEKMLAIAAIVITFGTFYVYSYTGSIAALLVCLVAAFAYSIGMNLPLLKKAFGAIRAGRR